MNYQALQYYMHDGPAALRVELAGFLTLEGVRRLDRDWRTASSRIGVRRLIVDMTFVTCVDEHGRALLVRWHREGAQFVATSRASRMLAESILGESFTQPARETRTWLPFRSSFVPVFLLLLTALFSPAASNAATLKSETLADWEEYLRAAKANLQERVCPGGKFLWTFEDGRRAERVRRGEIVVVPAPGPNPKKVSGGLIHHWMGSMFVSNVSLDEMLQVTQDYDRFPEFYHPYVVASRTIARNVPEDRFSMVLMNKAFFLKTAIDADYQATNVRLDDRRFYSISRTTRVQEIEEFGERGEHRMPEGEGGGYIWRLFSIARFEQRDGGVYVELEVVALSRDVPAALRFVVDPIVRRVSRNSLLTSLQQTQEAVRGNNVTLSGTADITTRAGHLGSVSAPPGNKAPVFTSHH